MLKLWITLFSLDSLTLGLGQVPRYPRIGLGRPLTSVQIYSPLPECYRMYQYSISIALTGRENWLSGLTVQSKWRNGEKNPRTNKYMCFRSRMKWIKNNLCLSWILMRGAAIVRFASGQFQANKAKVNVTGLYKLPLHLTSTSLMVVGLAKPLLYTTV